MTFVFVFEAGKKREESQSDQLERIPKVPLLSWPSGETEVDGGDRSQQGKISATQS